MKFTAVIAVFGFFICCGLWAGGSEEGEFSWPEWRGPEGDGSTVEDPWSQSEAFEGEISWQADVGDGFSSVAVADGKVYTLGNTNRTDTVYCLRAKNGKVMWEYGYPAKSGQYPGPRSTPTIIEDKLIVLSRNGDILCFNRNDGTVLWSRNLVAEEGVRTPEWDLATSPVVRNGIIYLNINRAGVALRLENGETYWSSESDRCGYASPVFLEHDGLYQVIMFGKDALHGVDPDDGTILWSYEWRTANNVNAADPLVVGNRIFISSNYRRGCAVVQVAQDGVTALWENNEFNSHFSSFVFSDGYIYGNDGDANAHRGAFKCVDIETGALMWQKNLGFGSLLRAGDHLVLVNERRQITVAELNPAEYREVGSMSLPKGLIWTPPVLVNGRLYIRSMTGELYCIAVKT